MSESQYGRGCKLDIPETNPDINQHTEDGNRECPNGIRLHFLGNGTGDIFRNNFILGDGELLLNTVVELCSLFR